MKCDSSRRPRWREHGAHTAKVCRMARAGRRDEMAAVCQRPRTRKHIPLCGRDRTAAMTAAEQGTNQRGGRRPNLVVLTAQAIKLEKPR